jgi:type I restriction enzyme, S subunit
MVVPHKNTFSEPIAVDISELPQEDLNWSTVALAEVIKQGGRLEASVFDIHGKHAREILSRCKWKLKPVCGQEGFAKAYHRPRFKRIFLEKSEYPIYQPSQINEIYPKPYVYISDLTNTSIDDLRVKKNQILLTCSGTIGNCTLVSRTLDNCIFSHDLLRITANDDIDSGYLYAFFRTDIGRTILITNNYGAVVQHIEPEHLENIPIPDASPIIKREINDLILQSFKMRDESNDLIDHAEKLLISVLKLPPIEKIKPKYFDKSAELRNYSAKLSETNNRVDASYHVPMVKAILRLLSGSAKEITTLGDTRISKKITLPGRFKRIYVEEGQGVAFIGGKNILELDPSGKKYLSISKHNDRIKSELLMKENTVLITRSGTIGKMMLVPKHWRDWVVNEHVIRIVPANDDIAGYIYTWLSSDYGYELINRFTYGAVVDEIDDTHVSNVQIPLLEDANIQKEINRMVLDANDKRFEAYHLEQKAVKIMNDMVIYSEG